MTSGGRELLKWLALALMTGDHVVTVFHLGYVPVVSELGRVAFPVFALVMAFNLAQPGADAAKSARRLAAWGIAATPVTALAFGQLLPLNVLLTFAAAAACVWAIERRYWMLIAFLAVMAPAWLDYAWPGVWLVLAGWCGTGGRLVNRGWCGAVWACCARTTAMLGHCSLSPYYDSAISMCACRARARPSMATTSPIWRCWLVW